MITLLEGETILLIRRKHRIIIIFEGLVFAMLAVAPISVAIALHALSETARTILTNNIPFTIFYATAWIQVLLMVFFINWTNYYLDTLIVTNKRIIDIEQIRLFSRDIAEIRLENIQDIKVEVIGVIASLFKMGDIHIQTAGQSKEVLLKHMPNPNEIRSFIVKRHDVLTKEETGESA